MKKIESALESKLGPKKSIFGVEESNKDGKQIKDTNVKTVKDTNVKTVKDTNVKKENDTKKDKTVKDTQPLEKDTILSKKKKKITKQEKKEIKGKKRPLEENKLPNKQKKKDEKMKTPMSRIERKILTQGTAKDKINVLTLQVERNPSRENYKELLVFAENQRNDVIYEVLKNVKDLLLSKGENKDWFVKQKIVKTFEINLKNIFIKQKVLKLVFQLLKNNIYFLELIYPFLNKLGDKKELEDFVVENCKSLFPVQEEIILENIEDFYFKNPSFKARYSLLKLLGEVTPTNKKGLIELYFKFGEAVDLSLPEEQRTILLKHLLGGLSSTFELKAQEEAFSCSLPTSIVEILKASVCPKLSLPIFKILYFSKSESLKEILYRLLSFPPSEELMALVFKYVTEVDDKKILKYIFNRSILYKKELVLAILYLVNRNKVDLKGYYGLSLLSQHYSLVVRNTVLEMLSQREIREIKPFDGIDFEIHENK